MSEALSNNENEVTLTLEVNGKSTTRRGPGHLSLLRWLRDLTDTTDPKYGCGEGICGACTVLVDGEAVSSCIVLAAQVDGAKITTASGLLEEDGSLSELQEAFCQHHAAQCGFCTPGMLVAAHAILYAGGAGGAEGPGRAGGAGREPGDPLTRDEMRQALHGNLCRCTGYGPILDAMQAVQAKAVQTEPVQAKAVQERQP